MTVVNGTKYHHKPEGTHPLRFSFTVGARRVRVLYLNPPAYGDLVALREADAVGAYDLLAALTGEHPEVIARVRWPDIESALELGLPMLPVDLRELYQSATEPVDDTASIGDDAIEHGDVGDDMGADAGDDDETTSAWPWPDADGIEADADDAPAKQADMAEFITRV